jgi:hypothetical protein
MIRNTRESALRREEFHAALQNWLDDSYDVQIGDAESHAGAEWLWVRHGGSHFYLHAGSTRAGVREYLRMVADADGDVAWHEHRPSAAARGRVTVGVGRHVIDGFEFFRDVTRR